MKILTIIGARPQFIKAGALSREIRKNPLFEEVIIHTGQHFDANMSDIFFDEMDIPKPNYNLNINGLSHGAMTGQMLEGIENIILMEKPNIVLVYGDTNSTLAGAIAAKKLNVNLAHVEAGLRSHNMQMPEEINRILTDRISDWLFCPTDNAVNNLKNEGFDDFSCKILKSGDVMEQAALFYAEKAEVKSRIISELKLIGKKYILATIHRAENSNDIENLKKIIQAFNQLNTEYTVILPLHPGTKIILEKNNIKTNFSTIDPVGYFDMIMLLKNCALVITDSGGLQKEAFFFRKYCVTIREQTEWVELVENGYNFIVGTNLELIIEKAMSLINEEFPETVSLFGNGKACEYICQELASS